VVALLPRLARELRFRDPGARGLEAMRGLPTRQILSELGIPWWKVPLVVWRARALLRGGRGPVDLFPGVAGMLRDLDAAGLEWGIITTNGLDIVRESLRGGDAPEPGWLEAGIGLFGKPGRLVRMVQARGLDPSRVVLVADETRDFEAAGSAGIGFVGVAWGYATPEVLHAAGAKEVMATVDRLRSRLLGEPEVPGGHDLPGDEVRS
jgi:phosphoglycolate phosphatase